MKKAVLFFVVLINMSSLAIASPFLVCDPAEGVHHYVIMGAPTCLGDMANIPAQPDGSIRVDLPCIILGAVYQIKVLACNAWGDCSPDTPFELKRAVPGATTGTRVSK
jgi:hypothetical protein